MTRLLSIALTVVGLAVGGALAWDRWAPFEAGMDGLACPRVSHDQVEAEALRFETSAAQSRSRSNGVLIRAAVGQPAARCRQVVSRATCDLTGPSTVRAYSDETVLYVRIPQGQAARLRAHRGRIACVLKSDPGEIG